MTAKLRDFFAKKYVRIINILILAVIVGSAIVGQFWGPLLPWLRQHYLFETITLIFLLEIFLLVLTLEKSEELLLCGEDVCQSMAINVVGSARYFDILSAGIGYRKVTVTELLKKNANIRLLIYNPEVVVDPDTKISVLNNIEWIFKQVSKEESSNFEYRIYHKPASIRLMIAYRDQARRDVVQATVGWYTYEHVQNDPTKSIRLKNPLIRNILLLGTNSSHRALLEELIDLFNNYWKESVKVKRPPVN